MSEAEARPTSGLSGPAEPAAQPTVIRTDGVHPGRWRQKDDSPGGLDLSISGFSKRLTGSHAIPIRDQTRQEKNHASYSKDYPMFVV